jgi:hypothetical protein
MIPQILALRVLQPRPLVREAAELFTDCRYPTGPPARSGGPAVQALVLGPAASVRDCRPRSGERLTVTGVDPQTVIDCAHEETGASRAPWVLDSITVTCELARWITIHNFKLFTAREPRPWWISTPLIGALAFVAHRPGPLARSRVLPAAGVVAFLPRVPVALQLPRQAHRAQAAQARPRATGRSDPLPHVVAAPRKRGEAVLLTWRADAAAPAVNAHEGARRTVVPLPAGDAGLRNDTPALLTVAATEMPMSSPAVRLGVDPV